MGTSTSALELSRKFDRLAQGIGKAEEPAGKAGAQVIARKVRSNVRAATGGDFILSGSTRTTARTRSGKPRRAARIDVFTAKARSVPNGSFVGMRGPAHLIENDVDKHYVFSRYARAAGRKRISRSALIYDDAGNLVTGRGGRAKRRRIDTRSEAFAAGGRVSGDRRAVLNLGNGNYKRWTVAYSKGRQPWARGVRAAQRQAVAAMRREETKPLFEVFR